jgi:hypothetical protein
MLSFSNGAGQTTAPGGPKLSADQALIEQYRQHQLKDI